MQKKIIILCLVLSGFSANMFAQSDSIYFKGATKENRVKLHRNIQNSITKNLSLPLNDDTEENWADAFGAIELIRFKSLWVDGRINFAFDSIEKRTVDFQRALLELAYSNYPDRFTKQVTSLMQHSTNAKMFAMCVEYLLLKNDHPLAGISLENKKQQLVKNKNDDAIIGQLFYRIQNAASQNNRIPVTVIANQDFLKGRIILYSLQRKDRNYPGLAIIRDSAGNFVKNEDGFVFFVPQLARSIGNLPGYLTNGNTPQGIFRMYGFDTSKSFFIGPTTNIQLTMPFETSIRHFFNDSTITDTAWTEEWYKKMLPGKLKNYRAIYESFYAGKAGRTEIIAHGTTVDPSYYTSEVYYPQTPTAGCLCTKEIWSEINGQRLESDQQKLTAALQRAGGANGYCVVIEIDDVPGPVSINEILPLLNSANQNKMATQ